MGRGCQEPNDLSGPDGGRGREERDSGSERNGPGAVFLWGQFRVKFHVTRPEGLICERPPRGRVSWKAARHEKTRQGNLEGSVPRPEGLVLCLQYSSKRAFAGSIKKGVG